MCLTSPAVRFWCASRAIMFLSNRNKLGDTKMAENENNATAANSVNESELVYITAGSTDGRGGTLGSNLEVNLSFWTYCGEYVNGVLYYRPCPRCGKPMHTSYGQPKWYCDPCDFSEYHPRKEKYTSTPGNLINEAR